MRMIVIYLNHGTPPVLRGHDCIRIHMMQYTTYMIMIEMYPVLIYYHMHVPVQYIHDRTGTPSSDRIRVGWPSHMYSVDFYRMAALQCSKML